MPKKSRLKKKAKKVMKRKVKKTFKRKPARHAKKAVKKVVKKAKKVRAKAAKKVTAARKKMVKKIAERVIGKVTHYYDHIGVAVVAVQAPIRLGDAIRLKHGKREFTQTVQSLQVNHTPITIAAKGQEVGMKVDEVATEGTLVLPA